MTSLQPELWPKPSTPDRLLSSNIICIAAHLEEAAVIAVLRDALGREEGKLDDLHPAVPEPRLKVRPRPALGEHDRRAPRGHIPQVGVLSSQNGEFDAALILDADPGCVPLSPAA